MWELKTLAEADSLSSAVARRPLKNYQLCFMNDKEALAHAKQLVDGKALELWSGMRMMGRLESAETSNSKKVTP